VNTDVLPGLALTRNQINTVALGHMSCAGKPSQSMSVAVERITIVQAPDFVASLYACCRAKEVRRSKSPAQQVAYINLLPFSGRT
jgi:hypothetical protein